MDINKECTCCVYIYYIIYIILYILYIYDFKTFGGMYKYITYDDIYFHDFKTLVFNYDWWYFLSTCQDFL